VEFERRMNAEVRRQEKLDMVEKEILEEKSHWMSYPILTTSIPTYR